MLEGDESVEDGDRKRQLYQYQNESLDNFDSDNEEPQIQEASKNLEYKRKRLFNEKTIEWKTKYVQHLNKKTFPDAIRRANIAINILQPYQENFEVNFDCLIDPKIINKIIELYLSKSKNKSAFSYLRTCRPSPPPSEMTPSKSDCEWCAMF